MKYSHLFIVAPVLLLLACDKDGSSSPDPVAAVDEVSAIIHHDRENGEQEFQIDPTVSGAVFGGNGTIVTWQAFAFRDGNGDPVTASVTIKLLEALHPSDMVRFNMQTVAQAPWGKTMLKSGGAVRLRAEVSGAQVTVASGSAQVHFSTNDVDYNMQHYAGTEDVDGNVVWEEEADLGIDTMGVFVPDSLGGGIWYPGNFYSLDWPNLTPGGTWPPYGFFNCDHPLFALGDSTDVSVLVDADPIETLVWIVFPELNSMVYLEQQIPNGRRAGFPLRIGLNGTIVAFSMANGQYSSAFVPITVVDDHVQSINLQPTTLEQYHADLLDL